MIRGITQAFVALSAIGIAEALQAASNGPAKAFGGRAGDYIEVHFAPWRIVPNPDGGRLWDLHLATLDGSDGFKVRRYDSVYPPMRFGPIVIAHSFAPDGGGKTYILDAKHEERSGA